MLTPPFRILAIDPDEGYLTHYNDVLCYEGAEPYGLNELFVGHKPPPSQADLAHFPDHPSFDVCGSSDCDEALAELIASRKKNLPFAVVFIELEQNCTKDGLTLAEQIRSLDENIEIIILSDTGDLTLEELNRRVRPPEKVLFLQKPFISQELKQLVTALCCKWDSEIKLKELNETLSQKVKDRTRALDSTNQRLKRDIEKRVKVLRDLQFSEERYRLLFEKDVTANFVAGTDGILTDCNESFARLFDYDCVKSAHNFNLYNFWLEGGGKTPLPDLLEQNSRIQNSEMRYEAGKRQLHLLANFDAVYDEHGNLEEVRGYFFDMTERKKLERQLTLARRMESLGTLAGGIAHDFNNILGVIMGYAEIIENKAEDSGLRRRVGEITRAGNRARDLITQILNFSRQSPEERQILSLSPLIKEALKLLRSSIPKNVKMDFISTVADDNALADPTQIHQIMLNLCTNAAHAMGDKDGQLEIELSDVLPDDETLPNSELGRPNLFLRLSVSDTGHGLHPDMLERIFDPFFTTKKPGEGTGMGLSVVHGIIKRHEGDIQVQSAPGKGTTFHVFLPRAQGMEKPQHEAPAKLFSGGGLVLVVDDEKPLVDIAQAFLEEYGFTVIPRTSSIEALEAFRHKANQLDLVITDQAMPNMTGLQLAREMQEIKSDIPIIVCTGFSESISWDRLDSLGIKDLIMKPLLKQELIESVSRVLAERKEKNS
ncbi:MAG: response regulator [Desulfovibrio sp.]